MKSYKPPKRGYFVAWYGKKFIVGRTYYEVRHDRVNGNQGLIKRFCLQSAKLDRGLELVGTDGKTYNPWFCEKSKEAAARSAKQLIMEL